MARWCRVAECNIQRPSQTPSLVVFIRHMSQGRVCRLDAGYWSSQGRVEKGWNWVAECNNLGERYTRKNVLFLRWRGERYIPKNVFFLR